MFETESRVGQHLAPPSADCLRELLEKFLLSPDTREPFNEPVILLGDGRTYEKTILFKNLRESNPADSLEALDNRFAKNYAISGLIDFVRAAYEEEASAAASPSFRM